MILGIFDMFPIFMELTLRRQKTLFLYFNVSGTQTTSKWPANLRASIFGRKKTCGRRKQTNGVTRAKRGGPTRPDSLTAWDPPNWHSGLRCCRSFFPKLRLDLKTTIYRPPQGFRERERRRNRETMKQRSGAEDWRGKTPAGRCRRGLHLLQRLLHRLHDEEGVVHLWTIGLWK